MTRETTCGLASVFSYGVGTYAVFTGAVALGGVGVVLGLVLHTVAVANGGDE